MANSNDISSVFMDSLNERTALVKESMNDVYSSFCAKSGDGRATSLSTLIRRMEDLRSLLPQSHIPSWMQNALAIATNASERLASGHDPGATVAQLLRDFAPSILKQTWDFSQKSSGFDFDSLYERFRTEFGIEALFEHLISSVEALLKETDLDSRKVASQLERLRDSLRKSKGGRSYFQAVFSLKFAMSVLKNTAWEVAEDSKLGVLVKGFRKALEEAQKGVEQVTEKVQEEAQKELQLPLVAFRGDEAKRIADESAGSE